MLLYRLLRNWVTSSICAVRGHVWTGKFRQTCTRCPATQTRQYARHQGQRERVRRMNQILRGRLRVANGVAPGERSRLLAAVTGAQRTARARQDELTVTYLD